MKVLLRSAVIAAFTVVLVVILGGWQAALAQPVQSRFLECMSTLEVDLPDPTESNLAENEAHVWCIEHSGGELWVTTDSLPSLDVWLSLYDESGQLIAANDDWQEGSHQAILYVDVPMGNYRIVLRSYSRYADLYPYSIAAYTDNPGVEVMRRDCTITIAGQGWHASGGTGGLVRESISSPVSASIPVRLPPGFSAPDFNTLPKVAIIIVDDFGGINPGALSNTSTPLTNLTGISHGGIVEHHVLETLQSVGAYTGLNSLNSRVLVERVDIGSYGAFTGSGQSDIIAAALQGKIDTLIAQGVTRMVVNMSFTIIPCNSLEELRSVLLPNGSIPIPTYDDYLQDVQRDLSAVQRVIENATTRVTTNSLLKLIRLLVNDNTIVYPGLDNIMFVAAAGNLGHDLGVPLYPGAWREVINVTALDQNWFIAPYASLGEVALPGGWYRYAQTDYYYTGTSFAAPTLSVIAALWIQQPSAVCPFEQTPPRMASPIPMPPTVFDVLHFDTVQNNCPP